MHTGHSDSQEQGLVFIVILKEGLQTIMGLLGIVGLIQRIRRWELRSLLRQGACLFKRLLSNCLYIDKVFRLCHSVRGDTGYEEVKLPNEPIHKTKETQASMNLAIEILQLLPLIISALNEAFAAHQQNASFTQILHAGIQGAASAIPTKQSATPANPPTQ